MKRAIPLESATAEVSNCETRLRNSTRAETGFPLGSRTRARNSPSRRSARELGAASRTITAAAITHRKIAPPAAIPARRPLTAAFVCLPTQSVYDAALHVHVIHQKIPAQIIR